MNQNLSNKQSRTLQDYSSRLAGGGHFLGWQDRNDDHANWEACFELPEPIEYAASNGATGFLPNHGKSNILQNSGDFLGQDESQNGFVRSLYRFISTRLTSVEVSREDYRKIASQFDLSRSPIDLTSQMSAYRNALSLQIDRQATQAWRINQEISEVLKIFYRETGQALCNLPKAERHVNTHSARPLIFREIRQLVDQAIVGGAGIDRLTNYWTPKK